MHCPATAAALAKWILKRRGGMPTSCIFVKITPALHIQVTHLRGGEPGMHYNCAPADPSPTALHAYLSHVWGLIAAAAAHNILVVVAGDLANNRVDELIKLIARDVLHSMPTISPDAVLDVAAVLGLGGPTDVPSDAVSLRAFVQQRCGNAAAAAALQPADVAALVDSLLCAKAAPEKSSGEEGSEGREASSP